MAGLRTPSVGLALTLCAVALLAALAAVQPAKAQTSEEFAFRVAVRAHPNGTHLEFGIQRVDDEGQPRGLHLEYYRFAALDIDHHRWLYGDSSYLRQAPHYDPNDLASVDGARVRAVARLHPTRGLFQFGAQYELDRSQLPGREDDGYVPTVFDRKQFFPDDIDHHRWLYTGVIRFTRVWSANGTLDQGSTMEDDGSQPEVQPPPTTTTTEGCLAVVAEDVEAMLSEECFELLEAFCEDHPSHAWCVRRREEG